MSKRNRKHLIFAPHHDDAEFGMGGVIQRFLADGDDIKVVVATEGDYTDRFGECIDGLVRRGESTDALKHLGLSSFIFRPWMKENQGDCESLAWLAARIEEQIREYEPDAVYVCLPSFNQDHRALYEATMIAFRPGAQRASLYAYEYPGTGWLEQTPAFGRRYFALTEEQMTRKYEALMKHKSQRFDEKVGVTPQAAVNQARFYGSLIGCAYAECLYTIVEYHF